MKVTFTQSRRIIEDGFVVKRFHTGETVDLAEMAACAAIKNGWAVSAEPYKTMEQVVDEMLIELASSRAGRAA